MKPKTKQNTKSETDAVFTSLLLALLTGLEPKGTSNQNHVKVALFPSGQEEGENMLLFKADDSAFHEVYFQKTQKCCDLICLAYNLKINKHEITICLIELKGGHNDYIEEASEQILQTYNGILARIQGCKKVNIIWKALIVSGSSVKQKHGEKYRDLLSIIKQTYVKPTKETINLTQIMQKTTG